MNKAKVIIGGGTGFIGSAISRVFRERSYDVLHISRMPAPKSYTWTDISMSGLPKCDVVINVAGQNVLDPTKRWTPGFKQNVWASRVSTTRTLAEAIVKSSNPPKVFIHISGVGFYRPSASETYTEDSPGGDFDFISRLCRDWEEASQLPPGSTVRRAVIRSGVVLGHSGGIIKQLFWPFFAGLGGPIGSGKQFMPWIHLEDLTNLFLHIAQNDKLSGVFNGVAPEIVTNGQFSRALGRAMWRPALIPLPTFAVNMAFGEERAIMMTEGQRVEPRRTLESGFQYEFPDLKEALEDVTDTPLDHEIKAKLRGK